MEIEFEFNADEIKKYSEKLGTLHRSAFPSAVRSTLNGAAFDVKQRTMPESAKDNFVQRQPNFFKANSKVKQATGFDVDSMKSVVGFIPTKGTNHAVQDLEQQEHGGTIDGKSFIPMKSGRTGNSTNRTVKRQNRISTIQNLIKAKKGNAKTEGERFKKSAIHAGVGGFVLSEKNVLWRINSVRRFGRNTNLKMTPIQSFKKNRSIKVKATHFMLRAAEESSKKMPYIYKKEAEFQFKKHLG